MRSHTQFPNADEFSNPSAYNTSNLFPNPDMALNGLTLRQRATIGVLDRRQIPFTTLTDFRPYNTPDFLPYELEDPIDWSTADLPLVTNPAILFPFVPEKTKKSKVFRISQLTAS